MSHERFWPQRHITRPHEHSGEVPFWPSEMRCAIKRATAAHDFANAVLYSSIGSSLASAGWLTSRSLRCVQSEFFRDRFAYGV